MGSPYSNKSVELSSLHCGERRICTEIGPALIRLQKHGKRANSTALDWPPCSQAAPGMVNHLLHSYALLIPAYSITSNKLRQPTSTCEYCAGGTLLVNEWPGQLSPA